MTLTGGACRTRHSWKHRVSPGQERVLGLPPALTLHKSLDMSPLHESLLEPQLSQKRQNNNHTQIIKGCEG